MPGYNLSWLVWVALVPLFFSLRGVCAVPAFGLGLVFGLTIAVAILCWMPATCLAMGYSLPFSVAAFVCCTLYYSIFAGIFAAAGAMCIDRCRDGKYLHLMLVLPATWALLEIVQSRLMPGIPYTFIFLGCSQWSVAPVLQVCSITGLHGLSFLIVLVNAAIFCALRYRKPLPAVIAAAVMAVVCGHGLMRMPPVDPSAPRRIRVAMLNAEISGADKWDRARSAQLAERYLELNRQAAEKRPDLIVWSETAIPWTMSEDDDLLEAVLQVTYPVKASHIVGIPVPAPGTAGELHNAALFIEPDGRISGQYNKIQLLAETEANGYAGDQGASATSAASGQYIPGPKQEVASTPFGNIGFAICNQYCPVNQPVLNG